MFCWKEYGEWIYKKAIVGKNGRVRGGRRNYLQAESDTRTSDNRGYCYADNLMLLREQAAFG